MEETQNLDDIRIEIVDKTIDKIFQLLDDSKLNDDDVKAMAKESPKIHQRLHEIAVAIDKSNLVDDIKTNCRLYYRNYKKMCERRVKMKGK